MVGVFYVGQTRNFLGLPWEVPHSRRAHISSPQTIIDPDSKQMSYHHSNVKGSVVTGTAFNWLWCTECTIIVLLEGLLAEGPDGS